MQTLRGYIASTAGEQRVPQHVQNIVIRDYCRRHGHDYLLSAVEYQRVGCQVVLQRLLTELPHIHGIVFYSLWHLPQDHEQRAELYEQVLAAKSALHFAVEDTSLRDANDVERLEDVMALQQVLSV